MININSAAGRNRRWLTAVALTVFLFSACGGATEDQGSAGSDSQSTKTEAADSKTLPGQPLEELPVVTTSCGSIADSIENLADQADSIIVARLDAVQSGYFYGKNDLEADDTDPATVWNEQLLLEFEVVEVIKGEPENRIQVPIFGYQASGNEPSATRTAIFEACGLRVNETNSNELFGLTLDARLDDGTYRFQEILHLTEDGELKQGKTDTFSSLFASKEGQNFREIFTQEAS